MFVSIMLRCNKLVKCIFGLSLIINLLFVAVIHQLFIFHDNESRVNTEQILPRHKMVQVMDPGEEITIDRETIHRLADWDFV